MSGKRTKPATDKASVAGKNDLRKKKENEKYAQKILDERNKKQKQREKRSAEIKKQRAKQAVQNQKEQQKIENKNKRIAKREKQKSTLTTFLNKIKYYCSKDFLFQINYKRVFLFIVLPIAVLVTSIVLLSRSVFMNVPSAIRTQEYNGRTESESIAAESLFNSQQQGIMAESLKAHGSSKIKFYINSIIEIDDNNQTHNLRFGNICDSDYVLIATIYDENGDVLYRSLGLEAGKEINDAKFFKKISYGTHKVKVAVNAYDKETKDKIGTKYAKIELKIGI